MGDKMESMDNDSRLDNQDLDGKDLLDSDIEALCETFKSFSEEYEESKQELENVTEKTCESIEKFCKELKGEFTIFSKKNKVFIRKINAILKLIHSKDYLTNIRKQKKVARYVDSLKNK